MSSKNAPNSAEFPMNRSHRFLLIGAAWLASVPLLAFVAVEVGNFQGNAAASAVISLVWTLGFIAIFWLWASKDAVARGKSKSVAGWFTVAWLLLPVLAVFPYLFATRGLKSGLLASLQFACYLIACGIVFVGAPKAFFQAFS
jgi:hypothetical protein